MGLEFEESCSVSGQLFYIVRRHGKVIEESNERNMIMTLGRVAVARLFKGLQGGHGFSVGVGENGDPPNPDQVGLLNPALVMASPVEFARAEVNDGITSWIPCPNPTPNVRFNFLFDSLTANGKAIREFGLMTYDHVLFARRVRSSGKPIEKDRDLTIEGYWVVRF
ncbi:MAG: hypothetical protein LBO21_02725 [Synergistaceae bacterium]|nr:hypothetical protein [Synergistaceae bacterium]